MNGKLSESSKEKAVLLAYSLSGQAELGLTSSSVPVKVLSVTGEATN